MFLIKVLLISILSFILTMFLPWYVTFIVCFLVGLILSNFPGNNFFAGLIGIGIFWASYALFLDFRNQHILSSKIAHLFSTSLNTDITSGVLIMITTFLGAILGGLSSMAGAMLMDNGSRQNNRKAVKNKSYRINLK